jgi:hypothetical protein
MAPSCWDDYEKGPILGQGTFGSVFRAVHKKVRWPSLPAKPQASPGASRASVMNLYTSHDHDSRDDSASSTPCKRLPASKHAERIDDNLIGGLHGAVLKLCARSTDQDGSTEQVFECFRVHGRTTPIRTITLQPPPPPCPPAFTISPWTHRHLQTQIMHNLHPRTCSPIHPSTTTPPTPPTPADRPRSCHQDGQRGRPPRGRQHRGPARDQVLEGDPQPSCGGAAGRV